MAHEVSDNATGGRELDMENGQPVSESYRNAGECPNCGSDAYCRGTEVVDYCIDCKTLFMDDDEEWSLRAGTDR